MNEQVPSNTLLADVRQWADHARIPYADSGRVLKLCDEIERLQRLVDALRRERDMSASVAGRALTELHEKVTADEPSERHPMLAVLAICTAYESGYGFGLVDRPKGNYTNPYDPVNSPHESRAWAHGYEEGIKKRTTQPPSPGPGTHPNCTDPCPICDRMDAERYRFLRGQRRWYANTPPAPGINIKFEYLIADNGEALDIAIDRATSTKEGGQ